MKRIALALLFASCTDSGATERTLRSSGYTDITVTGYEPFACGDDDAYSTGFRAKNPSGQVVEGVVCCGLLTKGCTVRF